MKTIRHKSFNHGGKLLKSHALLTIKRVTDEEANEITKKGEWEYCPKSVWRKEVRDAKEAPTEKKHKKKDKK